MVVVRINMCIIAMHVWYVTDTNLVSYDHRQRILLGSPVTQPKFFLETKNALNGNLPQYFSEHPGFELLYRSKPNPMWFPRKKFVHLASQNSNLTHHTWYKTHCINPTRLDITCYTTQIQNTKYFSNTLATLLLSFCFLCYNINLSY